jgi:ATP-dependent helicase HrpA
MLDEVHERSFSMDIILGCLKTLHNDGHLPSLLKIILCSATVDHERFAEFFNDCKIISILGATHPIEDIYRPPYSLD